MTVDTFLNEKDFDVVLYKDSDKSKENGILHILDTIEEKNLKKENLKPITDSNYFLIDATQESVLYNKVFAFNDKNTLLGTYYLYQSKYFRIPSSIWDQSTKFTFVLSHYFETFDKEKLSIKKFTKKEIDFLIYALKTIANYWSMALFYR